jgi:putative redox protein
MNISLTRKEPPFYFEALAESNISVHIDASEDIGGSNQGVRPMELVLMGLGGCASIDLGLILKKQKQVLDDYSVKIDATRKRSDAKEFETINLHFSLTGNLDPKKVERALDLTFNKYCSVAISLSDKIKINYSYEILKA